jgi:hypothetical protein
MPQPPSAYDAHQRQRWTRHDAHLWIRHDAARFLPPGMDPADLQPTLARKSDAANAAAFEAEVAAGYRLLAVLREEVASLRADLKRRRELEAKYSPSQPRVPAGNPRGGQWTDRSGGQGQSQGTGLAQPMGNVDIGDVSGSSELGDLFQIKPSDTRVSGVQLAGDGRPLEINPGELVNQHILAEHVGKTDEELIARIRRTQFRGLIYTFGMDRNGSFDSIESARDFISQTLRANSQAAQQVASGQQDGLFLTYRFGYRTGKEAYLDVNTSRIEMRPTYDVGVEILHDASRSSGYRAVSAYPRNYNPRIGR